MLEGLDRFNGRLAGELQAPLEIGIGVHTGEAIVGRMGPPKTPIITALGDTVNTTARLEGLTKGYGAPVVVSLQTFAAAGLEPDGEIHEARLRGRTAPLPVAALGRAALASCLARRTALPAAE
jgi:adenylate cyclase